MTAKDLEIWSAQSLCDIGIVLSVATFVLHAARSYFEQMVHQLQAKMAEEIWWVSYLLVRDLSLFGSILIGLLMLNPDLMADIKIGLPFVPFATVVMIGAGVLKLGSARSNTGPEYRRITLWLAVAATLNAIGYTLVMESPGDEYVQAKNSFWQVMEGLKSNHNPDLAIWSSYISWGVIVLLAVVFFVLMRRRPLLTEESPLPHRRGGVAAPGSPPTGGNQTKALRSTD